VLLYELLTGTTPFDRKRFATAAYDEIRRIIRDEEPPKPSTRLSTLGESLAKVSGQRKTEPARLSALVKGDLDWIVMKALEKERTRRYETASSFAADVRRFLAEEPIEARPPSAWYRFRKMARRNKAALTTTGIVAAALILGMALSIWQAVRATRAEHDAVVQRDDATEQRNEATAKRREAETAKDQLRRTLYAAHLNLAQASWEGGRTGEVLQLLDREKAASPDLCGFEWQYWRRQCTTELATLKLSGLSDWAAFSADGSRLTSLNLGPNDPAKGGTAACTIWETGQGRPVASFPFPDGDCGSSGPTLSADGTLLAFSLGYGLIDGKANGRLVIVDATTGLLLTTVRDLPGLPGPLAFRSDGKQVAAVAFTPQKAGSDKRTGKLTIWDTMTGEKLHAFADVKGFLPRPAFSPDGTRIAIVSNTDSNMFSSEVKVWEIATGKLIHTLQAPIGGALAVTSVAFSPDEKTLFAVGSASSGRSEVHAWDLASGQPRFTFQGPFRDLYAQLAFSPDGSRLTCAGGDPRVGLWDAATGKELAMYRGHTSNVSAVAFSRDGRHLLSADGTEAVKVWDAQPPAYALVLNLGAPPLCSAVSPDARRVATMSDIPIGVVKVWDLAGKQLLSLKRSTARDHEGGIHRMVVFSPNGDRLACATTSLDCAKLRGGLVVWDAAGKELWNLDEEGGGFDALVLSPDGTRIAAAGDLRAPGAIPTKTTVRIWEIATGRQPLALQAAAATALTFSPDGARLAAACAGQGGQPSLILVWDAATGRECARWSGPTGFFSNIAFSPDGRRIASTVGDMFHRGELLVGNLESGGLMKLGRAQGSVVFSPDGTRLAAFSALLPQPAEVSLWDVTTGRQLLVLKGHAGISAQDGLAFSPTGDRIVSTASLWGTNAVEVKTWDATPLPTARQP
jgi:WD40 repeat protein